jgi:hypothetical protein
VRERTPVRALSHPFRVLLKLVAVHPGCATTVATLGYTLPPLRGKTNHKAVYFFSGTNSFLIGSFSFSRSPNGTPFSIHSGAGLPFRWCSKNWNMRAV